MVTLPFESIFGSGLLVVCVFLKLLWDIELCIGVVLWCLMVIILTVGILKRNGYALLVVGNICMGLLIKWQ
jgi:hypothetical protein